VANYSADADLALYVRESGVLPTLTTTHAEAKRVIDAYLRAKGLTDTLIADLGTTTLAQLKAASCFWVLATFFASFVGDVGADAKAAWFSRQYQSEMSALYIEYSGSEGTTSDTLSSGDCILG